MILVRPSKRLRPPVFNQPSVKGVLCACRLRVESCRMRVAYVYPVRVGCASGSCRVRDGRASDAFGCMLPTMAWYWI